MSFSKEGFLGHLSHERLIWCLQSVEIQASMRSIVVPFDKFPEQVKILSESPVSIKPFF